MRVLSSIASIFLFTASVACFEANASTSIVVSVSDQKLALVRDGERVAQYRISTSKFGTGDAPRSYATPLGKLEVAQRIGDGLPEGAVLKGRNATGEILPANARGRDPIVTRILHLRGRESRNEHAFSRGIYIHGTPVERTLGKPDSWGCIRMRSKDVIALFESAPVGTTVEILDEPLSRVLPGILAEARPAPTPVGAPPTLTSPAPVASANAETTFIEHRRLRSTVLAGGRRLASAQDERHSAERPQHMRFGMVSITDLQSLGGVDQLRRSEHPDARDRENAVGVSAPVW